MPVNWLSVPHFEQEHPYSCTPACVRMVLEHFGCSQTEDELRQLLQTTPHGTVVKNIFAIRSLGFDVQLGTATLTDLETAVAAQIPPMVYLATSFLDYWAMKCDHVAVFVGADAGIVYLNDPYFKGGPQTTSVTNFLQAWDVMEYHTALITPRP